MAGEGWREIQAGTANDVTLLPRTVSIIQEFTLALPQALVHRPGKETRSSSPSSLVTAEETAEGEVRQTPRRPPTQHDSV